MTIVEGNPKLCPHIFDTYFIKSSVTQEAPSTTFWIPWHDSPWDLNTNLPVHICWRIYHHHHHAVLLAQIFLTLSLHSSLSSITSCRSFRDTSCISTELLSIGFGWSPQTCSSVWRCPQEYIAYEFVLTSPAVSCIFWSSYLDVFWYGR